MITKRFEVKMRAERDKIRDEAATKEILLEKELSSLRAQLATAKASSNSELASLQQRYNYYYNYLFVCLYLFNYFIG